MYAQILIAASFCVAAYQDVKDRAVSDLVWIPALGGVAYILYSMVTSSNPPVEYELVKVVLIGGVALAAAYFGFVGEADAIALAFVAADPYRLSPIVPLVFGSAVALVHIGYEFANGNARGTRTIPMEKFLREQRWIPKAVLHDGSRTEVSGDVNVARDEVEASQTPDAMVEVSYGVPTVAYLGVGYVAFIIFLAFFSPSVFASLP